MNNKHHVIALSPSPKKSRPLNIKTILDHQLHTSKTNKNIKRFTKSAIPDFFELVSAFPIFSKILQLSNYNNKPSTTQNSAQDKTNDKNSDHLIRFMTSKVKIIEYDKDTNVYNINTLEDNFYMLLLGKVNVIKGNKELNPYNVIEEVTDVFGTFFNYTNCESNSNTTESIQCLTKAFLLQINYQSYLKIINVLQSEKYSAFVTQMKQFSILYQKAIPSTYEKAFNFYHIKIYNKDDIIYKEGTPVSNEEDGLHFIIKGTFEIAKNPTKLTENDKLDELTAEIKQLKKENTFLMTCLNSKYEIPLNKKKASLSITDVNSQMNKRILTKIRNNIIELSFIQKGEVFGDFEYVDSMNKHPYTIKCTKDKSITYFIKYIDIGKLMIDAIYEAMQKEVEAKKKLFSMKYHSSQRIVDSMIPAKEYYSLPIKKKLNNINRNKTNTNIEHTFSNDNNNNMNFPFTNEPKMFNTTFYPKRMRSLMPLITGAKTENTSKDAFYYKTSLQNKNEQLTSIRSMSYGNSNNNNNTTTNNIENSADISRKIRLIKTPRIYIGNKNTIASSYFSTESNGTYIDYGGVQMNTNLRNYLYTGVKVPLFIDRVKKKVVYHYGEGLKGNIKTLLKQHNPANMELLYRK